MSFGSLQEECQFLPRRHCRRRGTSMHSSVSILLQYSREWRQFSEFGLNKDQLCPHKYKHTHGSTHRHTPRVRPDSLTARQQLHFCSLTPKGRSLIAARIEIYFTRLCSQGIPNKNSAISQERGDTNKTHRTLLFSCSFIASLQ